MSADETCSRDVRIAIAVRTTSQSLGWIGNEAGIFQRLGVNVLFPAMETAAVEAVSGLLRGDWDFVEVGGAPIVQGRLDGHDTVMLLAAEPPPVSGFYLLARLGITEPAQLNGGRIGVLTETGQTGMRARAVLLQWGMTATLVSLGTRSNIYKALLAQEIDAGILSEEHRLAAAKASGLTAFPIPETVTVLPAVLASTRRFIAGHRDLVARVVQGYIEAIHLFKTNRAFVLPLLQRFLVDFDHEIMEEIYAFYARRFQPLPLPSPNAIQQMLNDFAATYPAARITKPGEVTDITILNKLDQSGLCARLYGQ